MAITNGVQKQARAGAGATVSTKPFVLDSLPIAKTSTSKIAFGVAVTKDSLGQAYSVIDKSVTRDSAGVTNYAGISHYEERTPIEHGGAVNIADFDNMVNVQTLGRIWMKVKDGETITPSASKLAQVSASTGELVATGGVELEETYINEVEDGFACVTIAKYLN